MTKLSYNKDFLKPYSSLIFPMMLSFSATLILNITRLIFVGDYGVDVVAGIAMANVIIGLILIVCQGFIVALSTLFAINKGAEKWQQITSDFRLGWYLIIALSIVNGIFLLISLIAIDYTSLPQITKDLTWLYLLVFIPTSLPIFFVWLASPILMNMGLARWFGRISFFAIMIEVFLQYFAIVGIKGYGGWGPESSPWVSFAMISIEASLLAVILIYHPKIKFLNLYKGGLPKFNWQRFKLIITNGLPIAGSNLGEMCLFSLGGIALATISTSEVASFEIVFTIIELLLFLLLSSTNATSMLVGNYIGSNQVPNAKYVFKHSIYFMMVVLIILGAVLYYFRFPIASAFIKDQTTINLIAATLIFAIITQLFNLINFTCNNSLRSLQDFKYSFITNSVFFILIGTPLDFIIIHYEIDGVKLGSIGTFMNIGLMIGLSALVLFLRIRKYFKMKDDDLVALVNKKIAVATDN